jgi:hypothetical protein
VGENICTCLDALYSMLLFRKERVRSQGFKGRGCIQEALAT